MFAADAGRARMVRRRLKPSRSGLAAVAALAVSRPRPSTAAAGIVVLVVTADLQSGITLARKRSAHRRDFIDLGIERCWRSRRRARGAVASIVEVARHRPMRGTTTPARAGGAANTRVADRPVLVPIGV
jgi:hypothetical protein